MEKRKFDIVALQELCWKGNNVWKSQNATFYQSCGTTNELGTGFIVLGKMQNRVIGWQAISERMCKIRIKGRFYNYSIINVHCPHEGRPDDEKEAFYTQLEDVYESCSQRDIKIVIGDFNAQVGREDMYKSVVGPHSLHAVTNDNGQRCINFAASQGMVVRSTYFPRKRIHKVTWRSPDNNTENQIDHVLIDRRFFSDIINVRTHRGANIDSDHYLVAISMRSKLSSVYSIRQSRIPRLNLKQLKNPAVAEEYAQQLETALPTVEEIGASSLEDGWNSVCAAISRTAETVLGTTEPNCKNDWFDGECQQIVDEKNAARKKMMQLRTRGNVDRYKQVLKEQKRVFRKKKRQLEDQEREEMEEFFRANDTRSFYKKINKSRNTYVPQASTCKNLNGDLLTNECEVIERWRQHFESHLNNSDVIRTNANDENLVDLGAPAADNMFPAPDLNEIQEEIKKLKNNKAVGKDSLAAELLKSGGENLAKLLHIIITKIWECEKLPKEWMEGIVCPIYKKGDKLNCENYRAITLLNAAYKLLSQLLYRRLSPLARDFVGSYQAGFTDARATNDQIFSLRQILQKCRELNVPTHHLFIDFKAAYDSVDRDQLWLIMHEYGFPDKLTRLIRATMEHVMCYVRIEGKLSNPFETRKGLKQGDGLSCLLFNIILEGVVRRAEIDTRGTIFRKSVQLVGFADDLDIIALSFSMMEETYSRLKAQGEIVGLTVNTSKTKYMRGRGSKETSLRLPQTKRIDGDEIEVVDEFVYLGSLVTADNNTSSEIQRRILAGNRVYNSLRKTLRSNKIRHTTKLTIYKSLIRPVVLYGHETWTMLEEDKRTLGVFERRVLRTIFGGVQTEDGEWRRRMNHELHRLLKEPPIVQTIKVGRLRWAGHVMRMADDNPVKMILVGNPDGTRRRGAQRARWLDQLEDDLKVLRRYGNWRHTALNRVEWRRLLDTARATPALI